MTSRSAADSRSTMFARNSFHVTSELPAAIGRGDSGHFQSLDALRGIAALAVTLHHTAYFYLSAVNPGPTAALVLKQVIAFGHPAVVLFFVLSGFVLSLSYSKRPDSMGRFIVKRALRIFPAFLLVLVCATAAYVLFSWNADPTAGEYWNKISGRTFSALDVVVLATLLVSSSASSALPIAWSLIQEIRFSIIFPALAKALARYPQAFLWIVILGLFVGTATMAISGTDHHIYAGRDLISSFWSFAFYLPMFGAGMLASVMFMQGRTIALGWRGEIAIAGAAIVIMRIDIDAASSVAAATIILLSLNTGPLQRALLKAPVLFLGRTSYSLYLIHFPVLFTVTGLFASQGSTILAVALMGGIAISVGLAATLYYAVELPSQRLSRSVSKRNASGDTAMIAAPGSSAHIS